MYRGVFSLRQAGPTVNSEVSGLRRRMLGAWAPMMAVGLTGSGAALTLLSSAQAASPASTSFLANFKGLRLQDQDGQRVQPERWARRSVLVNFVFTGCSTVCPAQTKALADMQSQLPRDVRARLNLLSISIDPLNDTPQALKAFAKRMGADVPGWTFATGRPEDVEKLSDALRLFRPGPDVRKPDDHSTALWLVDAQGQLRMRYSGNPPDVPRLLREIAEVDKLSQAAR